jgi:hypothetical protein
MADAVARAAVMQFAREHPEFNKNRLPPTFKWLAGIGSAIVGAAIIGYFNWLTNTVGSMEVTLARMDERQTSQVTMTDGRYDDLDKRVSRLEGHVAVH